MNQTLVDLHNKLTLLKPVHNYHLYGQNECPERCPWYFIRDLSPRQVVERVLSPISSHLSQTFDLITVTCENMVVLNQKEMWYLIYQLSGNSNQAHNYFCGGTPQKVPKLSETLLTHGWSIPPELTEFYQVHNGFGVLWPLKLFWNSDCVLPDYKLSLLSDHFSPNNQEMVDYAPNDLLEFFPDGAGNGQFFYRTDTQVLPSITVDWDHETRELSRAMGFWEFVDSRFQQLIM